MGGCCASKQARIAPEEEEEELNPVEELPKLELTKIKKSKGPPPAAATHTLGGVPVPVVLQTPRTSKIVLDFRERLHEYLHQLPYDTTLMRFLKARQWDLDKATEMYLNHRKWRAAFGADAIAEFDFHERPEVLKVYPTGYHQAGRLGHPVYIERVGKLDVDGLLAITTMDRYVKAHVQMYEAMVEHKYPACALHYNRPVAQTITIMDLEGVSMGFFFNAKNKAMLKRVISLDQDNYPECLYKMFVINAPWMFTAAYAVFKTFFDPATLEKIKIMGDDYLEELEKHIDPEHIPAFLGGDCKCEGGCLHRQPGPWDHYEPTEEDRRAWVVSGDEFADASPTGWDNNSTEELDDEEEVTEWTPNPPTRAKPMGAINIKFRRRSKKLGLWKVVPKSEGVFKASENWAGVYSKKTGPARLAPMDPTSPSATGALSPLIRTPSASALSPLSPLSPLSTKEKLSPGKLPPNTLAPLRTHKLPLGKSPNSSPSFAGPAFGSTGSSFVS